MRFLLVILFVLVLNFYVLFRLWNMIPAGGVARPVFLVLGVMVVASFFLFFVAGNVFPFWLTVGIYKVGTSWFFVMLYLLMVFLLADVLRIFGMKSLNGLLHSNWISVAVLGGFLFLVFLGGYINYSIKKRTELVLDGSSYGGIKESMRIVAISDLHLGYGIGAREFSKWIDKINAEEPDLVLIGGDLIDNGIKPLYHYEMAGMLDRIKARYGVFMVLGNHEYITGVNESLDFLSKTGVKVLRDSVVLVANGVYVAGRDDRSNGRRKSVEELLSGLEGGYPVVLLDHQPYELEKAEENGVFLQFSGHTHRGQVWPISWITDGMYEDSYGYVRKGMTHYYVSSGLGIWGGKFRIGSRSEYVVIDVKK